MTLLPCRWAMTKVVQDDSIMDKTLHFLLDHPRRSVWLTPKHTSSLTRCRCFIYLFPSHVTWFLAATLSVFTYVSESYLAIHTSNAPAAAPSNGSLSLCLNLALTSSNYYLLVFALL